MKNSTTCPKCDSAEIIRIPGRVNPYGGHNISVGRIEFCDIKVTRYLCGACGYLEEWVDSHEDIEKIRDKYLGIRDPLQDPTECLSCGAMIPGGLAACQTCGWSYDEEPSQV